VPSYPATQAPAPQTTPTQAPAPQITSTQPTPTQVSPTQITPTVPPPSYPPPSYPAPSYPGATQFPTGAPAYPPPPGATPYPGAPPAGDVPTKQFGPPAAEPPAATKRGRRSWVLAAVIGLLAGLLGGALGGVIGYQVAKSGRSGGVLGALPSIDSSTTGTTAIEDIAQRVLPSVVQLRLKSGERSGAGSGMVLTPDGLLLTNNHVVEGAAAGAGEITALFQDGRSAPVQIIGRDPSSDIAVVKAQNVTGLKPIELGNSDAVKVGQQVIAIGSPLGLGGTVTTGIVSALNRAVSLGGAPGDVNSSVLNAIQTDAAINPGNSGGPLVDIEGRLVGINSAIATVGGGPEDEGGSVGLGFSIPINQARRIADELQRTGQATKPVLGVRVEGGSRLAPLNVPPGAKLNSVTPDSPAAKAGLKAGDIIVKVNTRLVTYGDELVASIRALAPGETVSLTTSDGRTVSAVLGGEPVPATK
jgi:putative serine protease PepD